IEIDLPRSLPSNLGKLGLGAFPPFLLSNRRTHQGDVLTIRTALFVLHLLEQSLFIWFVLDIPDGLPPGFFLSKMAESSSAHDVSVREELEYTRASNVNVSNFVSVKLSSRKNYEIWNGQMVCLVESQNMGGIAKYRYDSLVVLVQKVWQERKPLVLPWGQTPQLDSSVRGNLILGFSSISLLVVVAIVEPLSGKVRDNRDCRCGFPTTDASRSAVSLRKQPKPIHVRLEIDLFAFICHSDPTKVRIGDRDLAEREVKLLKITEARTVSLDPPVTTALEDSSDSIDKLFDDANQEHSVERGNDVLEENIAKDASESLLLNTSGKSLAALHGMVPEGSGIPSGVTKPLIAASVPPMSDVGPLDFVSEPNMRTYPPHVRYVVSSNGSHHSGSYYEATSFVRSLIVDAPVVKVVVTTTIAADIGAFSGLKSRDVSKDLENIRDSASAGGANADATNILKLNKPSTSSDSFFASQSLDTEIMHRIYVYLGAEVRMRAEHTLERKGELEDKCAEQTMILSGRDAEIAHLKSLLSLKESESAEAIRLRGQLTTVEAADAAKDSELKDLKEKNFVLEGDREMLFAKLTFYLSDLQLSRDELNSQVASLESERGGLISQKSSMESAFELFCTRMEATQDEQTKVLGSRVVKLDGTAVSCAVNKGIQDGLRVRVDHVKAERGLSVVESYDPSVEAKYVKAVNALGAVDFSLLSELKSKKDASIVDLIDSLRLEGPLAEIPRAEDLQPSPDQLWLLIHRPEDNVVLDETSLSFSLQVVHSRVQRVRGENMEKRLSLTDVMVPLAEPLFSKSLIGEASTFAAVVTTKPVTTLSTTFASSDIVPLLLTFDDQSSGVEPHDEEPPIVSFEKEELVTSRE
nr:ankyrin repeat-containing protein [Tanacetum cinerariifolium]